MSKKVVIISVSALCVAIAITFLILGLAGVFSPKGKEVSLKSMDGYEKITTKPLSIKVTFSDSYVGEFTIVDEAQINKISAMLQDRVYNKRKKGDLKPPGTNRNLSFIYAESTTLSFDASWITLKDGTIYSPKTNDTLDAYLEEIGLSLGKIAPK